VKKRYGAFFKAERLVAKRGFHEPHYVIVMADMAQVMDRVKETIAFEEMRAAGNFEAMDEQEEAGGLQ
jgi:hypothetical protein